MSYKTTQRNTKISLCYDTVLDPYKSLPMALFAGSYHNRMFLVPVLVGCRTVWPFCKGAYIVQNGRIFFYYSVCDDLNELADLVFS